MRALLVSCVSCLALVGLVRCEEQFSANPPPLPPGSLPPASPSGDIEALLAPTVVDAGAGAVLVETSRAMTITLCSADPDACPPAEAGAAETVWYRVVFGSGRGVIRSREQATADLYKELRDRTASGQRLVAEPHATSDAGARGPTGGGSGKAETSSVDALAQSAIRMLDIVDGVGSVTLDVLHGRTTGCVVGLGPLGADGSVARCFIKEPERMKGPGRGGIPF